MPRKVWTPEQRENALLSLHDGATLGEVHADTGIPIGTLSSWKKRQTKDEREEMRRDLDAPTERAEQALERRERMAAATAAREATQQQVTADRRSNLAGRLMDEVHMLLDRVNSETVYKHVKTVGMGEGRQEVEVIDVHMDLPSATDTKALVTSVAILVDKIQILTGEATERVDHTTTGDVDLEAELRNLMAKAPGLLSQDQTGSPG